MSTSYSNFYFSRDPDSIPIEPGNMILDKDNDILVIDDDVNHRHYIGGGGGGSDSDLFTERRNILNIGEYPGEVIDTNEILYNSVGFCSCWDIDTFGIGANASNNSNGRNCWRAVFNPYNMLTAGAINNSIVTHTNIPAQGINNSAVFNAGSITGVDGIYSSLIFGQAAGSQDGSSRPFVFGSINGITGSVIFTPYGSNLGSNYYFNSSDVFLCNTCGSSSNMEFNHSRACFISTQGLSASNIGGFLSDVTLLGTNISNCSPYMSRFFGVWSNINIQDTGGPLYSDIFIYGGNFTTTSTGPYWSSIKSINSEVHTQSPYNDNITYIGSNMIGVKTEANPLVNLTLSEGNSSTIHRSIVALQRGSFAGTNFHDSIILGSWNYFSGQHDESRVLGYNVKLYADSSCDHNNIIGSYVNATVKSIDGVTAIGYNCNISKGTSPLSDAGNVSSSFIFGTMTNVLVEKTNMDFSIVMSESTNVYNTNESLILTPSCAGSSITNMQRSVFIGPAMHATNSSTGAFFNTFVGTNLYLTNGQYNNVFGSGITVADCYQAHSFGEYNHLTQANSQLTIGRNINITNSSSGMTLGNYNNITNSSGSFVFGNSLRLEENGNNLLTLGISSNITKVSTTLITASSTNVTNTQNSIVNAYISNATNMNFDTIIGAYHQINQASGALRYSTIVGYNDAVNSVGDSLHIFGSSFTANGCENVSCFGGASSAKATTLNGTNDALIFSYGDDNNTAVNGCNHIVLFADRNDYGGCSNSFIWNSWHNQNLQCTNSVILAKSIDINNPGGIISSVLIGDILHSTATSNSVITGNLLHTAGARNSFYGGYHILANASVNSVFIGSDIYCKPASSTKAVIIGTNIAASSGTGNAILNKSVIIGLDHQPAETIEEDGVDVPFDQPQVIIGGPTTNGTTDRLIIADSTGETNSTTGEPVVHELIRYTLQEEMIHNSKGDITFNYNNGSSTNISTLAAGVAQIGNINTILASIVGA